MHIRFALILICLALPVKAHEFWIEGILEGPDVLVLDLKVGSELEGSSLPYIPDHFLDYRVLGSGNPVEAVIGDVPAGRVGFESGQGIAVYHQAKSRVLSYDAWSDFTEFLAYEGLGDVAMAHRARGLPETGFSEAYSRFAKLVMLGQGGVVPDNLAGGRFEIVLERREAELRGVLLLEGQPLSAHRVNLFRTPGADPEPLETDDMGAFLVKGGGPLLLNAVVMRPDEEDADWHSLWASVYLMP